jgi:hypothetical protein
VRLQKRDHAESSQRHSLTEDDLNQWCTTAYDDPRAVVVSQ